MYMYVDSKWKQNKTKSIRKKEYTVIIKSLFVEKKNLFKIEHLIFK